MNESEELQPGAGPGAEPDPVPAEATEPKKWRRWVGHLMRGSATLLLLLVIAVVAGFWWVSSAGFEDAMRLRIIAALEDATGGRVEIAAFQWQLLNLQAEATGITIHGLEGPGEAPYAHVDRLHVRLGILGLTHEVLFGGHSPKVILREAAVEGPSFHLIVYPDGSTNQPKPRIPPKPGKPVMDTLFEAQIGQLTVEHGRLEIANHVVPLELRARDVGFLLSWDPEAGAVMGPASAYRGGYRIGLDLAELDFGQHKFKPVESKLKVALMLRHDSLEVSSLRLSSLGQTLELHGRLSDFARPVWDAEGAGGVDLRILAPTVGFVFTRTGEVSLSGSAHGSGGGFSGRGKLIATHVHYQDPVVDARTDRLTADFTLDQKQLHATNVAARLVQGGDVTGELLLENWLDFTPKPAQAEALRRAHKSWPIPSGLVKARLNGVTLDTMLWMLAGPAFRHLGLDTVVSGDTTSSWTGMATDLAIGGDLALVPSNHPVPGEAPVTGSVSGTFRVDRGAVDVRTMDVRLPKSSIAGNGVLGVFPIERVSQMDLDFRSSDMSEFDAVLRALNLQQGKRMGAAALPAALHGEAEFHGRLNSSWLIPRVDGHLTAAHIGIEIPDVSASPADVASGDRPLRFYDWDSLDVDGVYTPASIVVRHGLLRKGSASLSLSGHLDAQNPAYKLDDTADEFGPASVLQVTAEAQQFPLQELLPLAGITDPITGKINAKVDIHGSVNALAGSGSVEWTEAKAYGESLDSLHATGTIADQQLKITSFAVAQAAAASSGRVTGSGSLDLNSQRFQIDARGANVDLGSLERVKAGGNAFLGKLNFTVLGDGVLKSGNGFDPHLKAHATLSGMRIAGEPVADLQITATTSQGTVAYDLSSRQAAGEFTAHGQTSLNKDYYTQASLNFAKFDVGALLKLLKVTGITGQSDLEGVAKISGPLAKPEDLRGEATLNEFAVAIQGVHLASKGAVHATLVQGIARLDPVEITGEDTDLHLRASLALAGKQQLDLQADGAVNLRLAESLDPDLIASGVTKFQMEAHGPMAAPVFQGKVEFNNAALALQDFPNGLSQIKGTLEFIQNRLEVRSLTAMSGGGQLSVAGYLGFQHGLYADLTATGKAIRIRYPQGISSLADANLRLQGPQNNLLLSGSVEVTRFQINSDLDLSAFTSAQSGVPAILSPDAPSNHLRLDVHLTSAPQLNFQNAYAKLAGDVDLRLRGTLATPTLLGRISLTEGSASIGGTKYELQRGDIYFNNPVRIQPNIDLDATARVEDYDITLGLHGTPEKLNVSYRSEPPLPEADVIALLALGRTQGEQSAYAQQQQQAGDNPMTDALLGGALNATVSNRVQRLFGTGAIKVDPNFIGSLGNSTARVTVVEQIGKNLTFTYASNVNTTTQQLIQAEIAINRHVSLLVTQDESGVFSVVIKNRRRYR